MKKNKNKYIAVLSCLVVTAVLVVGISVRTADSAKDKAQNLTAQNTVPSQEKIDVKTVDANKNAPKKGTQTDTATDEEKAPDTEKEAVPQSGTEKSNETGDESNNESSIEDIPKTGDGYGYEYGDEFEEAGVFDDELIFNVPVSGQVAMDYSTEKMVYDTTLEQYRTNDSICYASAEGTDVCAAAQGTVESITEDDKNGTSITVFHGDGWRTTYSQLSKDVAVSEGDIVEKGQTIGYIGTPSMYSTAMGAHLEFKMTHNDVPIDPKTVIK